MNQKTKTKRIPKNKKRPQSNNYQDKAELKEFRKGFDRGEKFAATKAEHSFNDPQWYFKDNNILDAVASFSYQTRLGSNWHLDQTSTVPSVGYLGVESTVPGVMALEVAPTIGIATGSQDPANLAATNVYSFVRYKNSGAANYDAPDLMMYLISMDSLYGMWNWMKRLYGLASQYSQTNLYYPKVLIRANGVDFEDLINNLAQFRAYLNIKANEVSAFCVPATMSINIRHSWMFSNIYTDSDTSTSQTYMFVPSYFYKYSEASSGKGGELIVQPILFNSTYSSDNGMTVAQIISMFNSMIEAVQYSEDIGVMSGDILKAYGEGGLFKISTFEADYRVEPSYSKEVLSQIENADILLDADYITNPSDHLLVASDFSITQDPDTNWILFQPKKLIASDVNEREHDYLNFHWSSPTPSDVMVATRLKYAVHTTPSTPTSIVNFDSCGSEIILSGKMYFYGFAKLDNSTRNVLESRYAGAPNYGQPTVLNWIPIAANMSVSPVTNDYVAYTILSLSVLSAFDWHPFAMTYFREEETWLPPSFDFDYFTMINRNNITQLNTVALLTEFNVPN